MKEQEILDFARTEPNWEETLDWIISQEGIDPWDIDLVELANAFSKFVEKWQKFNFTVPARVVIVMAILLRIKVELLMWEEKEEKKEAEEVDIEELDIDVSDIPHLEAPKKRKPVRKATADELIEAFKKAFDTKERREKRKSRKEKRVKEAMPIDGQKEDIEERIEKLYSKIDNILENMKEGKTTFSDLLPEWSREEVVRNFSPLLRLNQEGRVEAEQDDYFKDIVIRIGDTDE
ncbi:MAG: segregation/condensation protein A [Candidatus Aenigmatarchaeota archaeon]